MAEEKDKKNKFQQRMDEQAAAMEKAYAELRETYDDPTDEQILAVAGNNLRGYQKKMGNKAANWGTAFGSNALWGTLNKDTRAALEAGYQQQKNKDKKNFVQSQNQVLHSWGDGDNKKSITKGTQMAIRNWGDGINEKEDLTPEQITALNTILTNNGLANVTIPTQQVKTKGENGEDVTNDVQQSMSYNDMLDNLYDNMSDDEKEAFELLGFVERDGNGDFMYVRPHNETFEEKLARKERERERIDMLTQQKAHQRQQARLGLADLAAGIGDMIKASGGAIVNPRDYRAMYDSLTEQQKTNYNNYLARMQALKEQEKAKRKEAADRAYQEKLLAEQRAYQEEQARKAQEFQASESKKNREHQESMLSDRLEAQKEIQRLKNQNAIDRLHLNIESKEAFNSAKYGTSIAFDGGIIEIQPSKAEGLYSTIYGIIDPVIRNHPAYVNDLEAIDKAYLEKNPKSVRVIVSHALSNPSVHLTPEMKEAIRKLINDAKIQQQEGDAGSKGITVPREADLVGQAVGVKPEDVVTSWWQS